MNSIADPRFSDIDLRNLHKKKGEGREIEWEACKINFVRQN